MSAWQEIMFVKTRRFGRGAFRSSNALLLELAGREVNEGRLACMHSRAGSVFTALDASEQRRIDLAERRQAFQNLGILTSHLVAVSSDEADALRRVFDSFVTVDGDDGAIRGIEWVPVALRMLQLTPFTQAARAELSQFNSEFNRSGCVAVTLGQFRHLCSKLRTARLQKPSAPRLQNSSSAPQLSWAPKRPQSASAMMLSGDDGGAPVAAAASSSGSPASAAKGKGAPSIHLPPTEAGGSAKARLSRSCSTITFDPLEIEIDHVQRSILGRAMRLGVTIADVVHEQQAYEEAMRRALTAKQAESVRRAQQNKEFVAARRIARRPMWRSTTPVGGTMTGAPSRAKKIRPAMSHDEANAWALKMQAWQKGYREGNPT